MILRTLISLAGGALAALIVLVGSWILISAVALVGWQVPIAAGIAVFIALFAVDFLTDYLEKRRTR